MPSHGGRSDPYRFRANRAKLKARGQREHLPCCFCGLPIDYDAPAYTATAYEADHIIPVSAGGTNNLDNLQASHHSCNRKAGAKRTQSKPVTFSQQKDWTKPAKKDG